MNRRIVHRAMRHNARAPDVPVWTLERPPVLSGQDAGASVLLIVVPLLGAGSSMVVMLLFRGTTFAVVGASMMAVTILISVMLTVGRRGREVRSRRAQRGSYLSYLDRSRRELLRAETERAHLLHHAHPPCRALPLLVRSRRRLWERRRGDGDFLRVRLGTGTARTLHLHQRGEQDPLGPIDAFMQAEMERLQRRFEHAPHLPVEVDVEQAGVISVVGDRDFCEHVARVLLSQAACFSAPDELAVALLVPPRWRSRWSWATWLPHLGDTRYPTSTGPRPRLAPSVTALRALLHKDLHDRLDKGPLGPEPAEREASRLDVPALLVVCDDYGRPAGDLLADWPTMGPRDARMTVVHLLSRLADEPAVVGLRVQQCGGLGPLARVERIPRRDEPPDRQVIRLDDWGRAEVCALARSLAGLRLPSVPGDERQHRDHRAADIFALLGLSDPRTIELGRAWAARPPELFLRVPIGADDTGEPVLLDLKEAAVAGMGPHGLCVGATGSGKSELLRMLVLALVATHAPEDLAMVLVDYKGGATFAPFAPAPHVHGVITNLGDDALLVERVYVSLAGEVRRRQELLKRAGALADISAYRRRRSDPDLAPDELPPMPHLLVVIDEFGELLTARPEFIELFLSIGRIGRSIGIHLLLSSQRIESGKLRGLEAYLSYRIGLRTLSEAESRSVLDTADAFSLPTSPGYGYLKVDSSLYRRFRSGFVSGAFPERPDEQSAGAVMVQRAPFYGTVASEDGAAAQEDDATGRARQAAVAGHEGKPEPAPSVLEAVMTAVAGHDRVGPCIWSAPLPEQLTLDEVSLPEQGGEAVPRPAVRVALGLVDDPARQRQGTWELDLSAAGNILVVGGPRSGRSTLLRTLTASLALSHSADRVAVYGVESAGVGLSGIDSLPSVAGTGSRHDPEVMRRAIADVHAVMTTREEQGRQDVAGQLRGRGVAEAGVVGTRAGLASPLATGASVVLLIDGLGPLCEEHPGVVDRLHDLLRRGPSHDVYLACTVSRRHEVRLQAQGFFTTVVEMRLTDPAESGISRAQAQVLLAAPAGRCLLPSGLFAQVALPRVDGRADRETSAEGLASLVRHVRASATCCVPTVRVLPTTVREADLETSRRPGIVGLGLDEADFSTLSLDLNGSDQHLLILGDPGTGKTNVLSRLVRVLVTQHAAEDLVVAQIDPRAALRSAVPPDYLGGYAASTATARALIDAVLRELEERARQVDSASTYRPPPPRIIVMADDYEAMTAGGVSPLHPLIPYLPIAREIGLHLFLARRAQGAARGLLEPSLAAVRESDATALLFSADPAEGPLVGSVSPARLPQGRALLVRPGRQVRTVQTAWQDPAG
ncbi:MAG: type VII secretion protein EccCa [Ornithinimicrobium sp.]